MDDVCDKAQFNCLVNQEFQRLNDLLHAQVINDKVMPYNEFIQRFGTYRNLTEKLQQWYWRHQPNPDSMDELLQILNDEGLGVPICTDALECDNQTEAKSNAKSAQHNKKESTHHTISEIQDQQKQMNAKLKLLMQEVSIAKVRIDINEGLTDENITNADIFPIENVADLKEFEESINDINISTHVVTLKRIINNEEINKSLTKVLSLKILSEHNLYGTNNKLALNAYPKLLQILHRTYDDFDSNTEFTIHLKEAIKRAKSRYHKLNWKHKQRNQSDSKKFKSEDTEGGSVYSDEDLSLDID